jgi:hypothetical protein
MLSLVLLSSREKRTMPESLIGIWPRNMCFWANTNDKFLPNLIKHLPLARLSHS